LSVTVTPPAFHASDEEKKRKGKQSRIELSQQWSLCTNRKGDVWCKREADVEKLVREQLKYNVKGSDLADKRKMVGPIAPVIRSMTGCRLLSSFGTFYRHPAIKRTKPAPAMCKCGCNSWALDMNIETRIKAKCGRR
jgi:hypothetical protein